MNFNLLRYPATLRQKRFDRHIEAMLPDLYKLAKALENRSNDAEDLVHDACVKALTSHQAANLPTEAACKAWVRGILINCFRDRYRRAQRAPVRNPTNGDHRELDNIIEFAESAEFSPLDWASYGDLDSAARHAMDSLPPEVRIVSTLYMVDEKSYKEIARIVACPLGTVMSRLARGRRLLREALGEFVAPEEQTGSKTKKPERQTVGKRNA